MGDDHQLWNRPGHGREDGGGGGGFVSQQWEKPAEQVESGMRTMRTKAKPARWRREDEGEDEKIRAVEDRSVGSWRPTFSNTRGHSETSSLWCLSQLHGIPVDALEEWESS